VGQPARPDFRGFAGRVCAGAVHPGDRVRVLPSGVETTVKPPSSRWTATARARSTGESVTLTLADEVDVSRAT
jgi:sulfate adenylyltransferase subunit 1 (EFTu-like GTPase family)